MSLQYRVADQVLCVDDTREATEAGKSSVMYGLAAIALAEDFADRVLVLCPSLTSDEGWKSGLMQALDG
jgi:hypothetical protein